jgi:hypothetical protein
MQEDWRPVVGYEGIYEVRSGSDGGKVRRVCALKRTRIGKLLGSQDPQGYMRAVLSKPGEKPKYKRLHTLILEAFVGPRPNGMEGCHADDNKLNNTFPNLYWGTRSSNVQDCLVNGNHVSQSKRTYLSGENHPRSVFTNEQRKIIASRRNKGEKLKSIAKDYNTSTTQIMRITKWYNERVQGNILQQP